MDHKYPVKQREYREALIDEGICPDCGDCLDTGWECTDYRGCGFDGINERYKAQPLT